MGTPPTRQKSRGRVPGRTVLTHTPSRMTVCEIILGEPGVTWTVPEVCGRLRPGQGPSAETVRATLYVLAAQGIVHEFRVGNALQFRLDGPGAARLRSVVDGWGSARSTATPTQVEAATRPRPGAGRARHTP
jgi:hypothetical protein